MHQLQKEQKYLVLLTWIMVKLISRKEVQWTLSKSTEDSIKSHQHGQLIVAEQSVEQMILQHTIHDFSCAIDSKVQVAKPEYFVKDIDERI